MKKIIAKSALALTIAAISTGAFAGTTTAVTKYFAQNIFGDGNSAVNGSTLSSNDTLIATPNATYTIDTSHAIGSGNTATVKFTLGGSAVFGEDLSDITKWNTSTANAIFKFAPTVAGVVGTQYNDGVQDGVLSGTVYTITVDSGGAIGDNTVVFKIEGGAGLDVALQSVLFTQVKVKNLAATLGAGSVKNASSKVALGAEFQVVTGADAGKTDTAVAKDILASKPVLVVGGTATTDAQRPLIQVASAEQKFTGSVGNPAKSDYDAGTAVAFINLGTLTVARAQYDSDGVGGDDAPVNKENGLAFDYQGSDTIAVKLTSATGWAAYDKVYLTAGACNATPAGLNGSSAGNDLTINLTGQTTAQLEAGYTLCAVAKTTAVIPETNSITATATADFFNSRYMNDEATKEYGVIRRNGCSISLFNLPNVNAADDGFIRFTNVSNIAGSIRASVWKEDGTTSDVDVEVASTIPAHGTLVFHTAADQQTGVYLGSKLPGFGALTSGRARIILTGAFPACEALGLVRSGNGPLVNMTSTTYSGDAAQFGADTNGTSNTKN